LIGTWRMLSWTKEAAVTGTKVDVHGPDPVGFVTYGADGTVHAIVMRRDRPPPQTFPPSDAEKIRLFDSMLAYAGTYTLDDEKAVHHVAASWNQAWTGTDQVRYYKLTDGLLTISTAPANDPYSGEEVIHTMTFCKV
jgi:hypothetical protein